MFGLKIRSWMESHIGRPRKKNNKNKNINGLAEVSASAIGNGGNESSSRKNTYANSSSNASTAVNATNLNCNGVISSPARRREVSPIQNQRQSRFGWHSPDHENISSPKSDNFLYLRQNQFQKPFKNPPVIRHKNDTGENTVPNLKANCSTSSISSLSWSTGSKEPSTNSFNNKHIRQLHLEQSNANTLREEERRTEDPMKISNRSNNFPLLEDTNLAQYEEICTTLRHGENNIHLDEERPKSEQFNYVPPPQNNSYLSKTNDDSVGRYGKLLPSRLQTSVTGSFDSINTNVRLFPECVKENNEWPNEIFMGPNSFNGVGVLQTATNSMRTFGGRLNSSNQTVHMGHVNHIGTAVSSPESAYSTGYSTDGTSPVVAGNCNPPEYYINMRTGTHYFPKSINSLTIEAQRCKFGLNKIEEMSPLEPLPKISFTCAAGQTGKLNENITVGCHSPLTVRNNSIVLPALQGFETSSPRQRCRIRTNPWYSTNENPSAGTIIATSSTTQSLTSSTLSTLFSGDGKGTKAETTTNTQNFASSYSHNDSKCRNDLRRQAKSVICSSSDSCSSTEVDPVKKTNSLGNVENITITTEMTSHGVYRQGPLDVAYSDDEATLNEMMGKFDESYIYEKETDILSDSDPTDCQSDLDTGREAGDECDTDELLDIDFIDTASIQEVLQVHDNLENTGTCYYFSNSPVLRSKHSFESRRFDRSRRSFIRIGDEFGETGTAVYAAGATSQRRRKRFLKTRKKSAETKDRLTKYSQTARESRSLGGTPVSLRRNQTIESEHRGFKNSQLSNRSNSLVLSDLYTNRCMMESEKGLLKADLEADVKYRQLILEAESLLVSMKSSLQSIPRETPVSSPRRLNPLANKRVEMLKNSDHETKKSDRVKSHQQQQLKDQELMTAINKRIEILKYEIPKSPASPKIEHKSPRKTHLTNFINQNGPTELIARKPSQIATNGPRPLPPSPKLKLNGRSLQSPKNSPTVRKRRTHYQARISTVNGNAINSDSDSDTETEVKLEKEKFVHKSNADDAKNYNYLPEVARILLYNELDFDNRNIESTANICPQSEPLKRKIYKGSSTFERIKQNLNLDAASPQQSYISPHQGSGGAGVCPQNVCSISVTNSNQCINDNNKQQLILTTIADIKRSLENQSFELNGLNCD